MEDYPELYSFVNQFGITMSDYQKKYYDIYEEYIQTSQFNVDYLENEDGCYETFVGRHLLYSNREDADSIQFFEIAITKGNIEAMFEMGWYFEDLSVEPYSHQAAIQYYKMVIEHEPNSENREIIGKTFYHLGNIIKREDIEEGIELLKKAHDLGNLSSSYDLGMHYMESKYRNEEQMMYYLSYILEDVNHEMYNHTISNLIVFYEYHKKDFNTMIDFAYLDWLKNKDTRGYFPIQKYMKKVPNMIKLFSISIKINDFEELITRDFVSYFNTENKIDIIHKHLNILPISNSDKEKLQITFENKYNKVINNMIFDDSLPDVINKHILTSFF